MVLRFITFRLLWRQTLTVWAWAGQINLDVRGFSGRSYALGVSKNERNLFFKDFRVSQILSFQPRFHSGQAIIGSATVNQYCKKYIYIYIYFFSWFQMRKMCLTLDSDMMSDDPWIIRQDPLTQPPLCPSAPKRRLIWFFLIHRLSAAVCFGPTESDRARWKRNQWSVSGETGGSPSVRPQTEEGSWQRGDGQWERRFVWRKKKALHCVSKNSKLPCPSGIQADKQMILTLWLQNLWDTSEPRGLGCVCV